MEPVARVTVMVTFLRMDRRPAGVALALPSDYQVEAMALCADARLDGENLIGDPTEGALIVLAAKGGL